MGKKRGQSSQPNAPDLHQVLLDSQFTQPPHNPYYPDLGDSHLQNHQIMYPPPSYDDHSRQPNKIPNVSYAAPTPVYPNLGQAVYQSSRSGYPEPQVQVFNLPRQASGSRRSNSRNANTAKVTSFNHGLFCMGILIFGCGTLAYNFFQKRTCLPYLVHQPFKELKVSFADVREAQVYIAALGIVSIVLSILRCASGNERSYSCYLTLVAIVGLVGSVASGYLAYLAFHSPCSTRLDDLVVNTAKSLMGEITNDLPSPSSRPFSDSNVMTRVNEDPAGLSIFVLDTSIFIFYLRTLFGAIALF